MREEGKMKKMAAAGGVKVTPDEKQFIFLSYKKIRY